MTNPLPDGYVVHLPAPKHAEHLFGDPVSVKPDRGRDRHQQTERVCAVCGVVKVTVHHPDGRAWREWRLKDCVDQYEDDRAPRCGTAVSSP